MSISSMTIRRLKDEYGDTVWINVDASVLVFNKLVSVDRVAALTTNEFFKLAVEYLGMYCNYNTDDAIIDTVYEA